MELINSLRPEHAPELCERLSGLYTFIYVQLVGAATYGFVVFGDLPDAWTIAGAAVVLASGLYLLYRERRVKAAAEAP